MFFKREKNADKGTEKKTEPVVAAVIPNTVSSEIYQDMLKNNGIPFVCRQQGAGGYLKILTGGLLAADTIYVNERDLEKAQEIYSTYIEIPEEIELSDSEEE
ncbi:MAG: DUF2007 domain-containing protein [Clostridia bacterium]|nr:DUF2007 domain-containing protein [Clostridia bacterium]